MKTQVLSIITTALLVSGAMTTSVQAMGMNDESHWNKLIMEAADKNSDGKMTKDEFMKMSEKMAAKQFMMMDVNDDGDISKEEFVSGQR